MKIFLSAVSGQFREVRVALASDLRAVGNVVEVQEDFQLHGFSLLEKLQESVAQSDRVIALVGDAYGAEPPEAARPEGQTRRSYTQWEYDFALGKRLDGSKAARKPIYVYFADPTFLKDHPAALDQGDEPTRLQREFVESITGVDKHYNTFRSLDHLCRLALRDGFQVRDLSPRPRNLPFDSLGTLFKGREAFLGDLRKRLTGTSSGPVAIVAKQAIHGLGGVGKTRAALEYAWRFEEEYSALLFVSAPEPAALRTNLANLVGVLAFDAGKMIEETEERRLAEVLSWLRKNPRWLLILDNVDTTEAARATRDLLASLSGGDLLITSRIANWAAGVQPLELHVLPQADAVSFLLERTPNRRPKPEDPTTAAEIAHDLDGLALALEQAGAYIDTLRLSLPEYRSAWKSHRQEVLEWHDPDVMTYPASVAVTWATTFDRLDEPERRLLQILAWMAPDPIPLSLFEANKLNVATPRPRPTLAGLARYSLARFSNEGDSVEVHRLVQEIVRTRISESDRVASLRGALEVLEELIPSRVDDVSTWYIWLPLAPHADMVLREADKSGIAHPTAGMMNRYAAFLKSRSLFTESEPLFQRAVSIYESFPGVDQAEVIAPLVNLGIVLSAMNRLSQAEPLYRRALSIANSLFGPRSPVVIQIQLELARLVRSTNRISEAGTIASRALSIRKGTLGDASPELASFLQMQARGLLEIDHLHEAEPKLRRSLSIREQLLDEKHPDIASSLNDLAILMRRTDRDFEAESLFRRALPIWQNSYGPDHPEVATALTNLASLLEDTDRSTEAELLYRRALSIRESFYGPTHHDVANSLNNLALLLMHTGRTSEAEPLLRRALPIWEDSYGIDHPTVASALSNLAFSLLQSGRASEAELLYRREFSIWENLQGPEHLDVAIELNNWAKSLYKSGRFSQAEPLYRRGLIILIQAKQETGDEHPDFSIVIDNYRDCLENLGRTSLEVDGQIADLYLGLGFDEREITE